MITIKSLQMNKVLPLNNLYGGDVSLKNIQNQT